MRGGAMLPTIKIVPRTAGSRSSAEDACVAVAAAGRVACAVRRPPVGPFRCHMVRATGTIATTGNASTMHGPMPYATGQLFDRLVGLVLCGVSRPSVRSSGRQSLWHAAADQSTNKPSSICNAGVHAPISQAKWPADQLQGRGEDTGPAAGRSSRRKGAACRAAAWGWTIAEGAHRRWIARAEEDALHQRRTGRATGRGPLYRPGG